MNNEENTKKKRGLRNMSQTTKWIITIALLAVAVFTVVMCAVSGNFSFKPGTVQANDKAPTETKAPQEKEDKEDKKATHKVLVSAGNGGSTDPSGSVTVEDWGSVTVNVTPNKGYKIQSVKVDGENMGAVSSYTLSYIKADHTIIVTFEKKPEPTPTPTPDDILSQIDDLFGDDE